MKFLTVYRWIDLPRLAGLTVVYAFLAKLVLTFSSSSGNVTIFWIPGGVALAALLLWGNRYAPAVFLAALVAGIKIGDPLPLSALIALGNTLESLFAAWLLKRLTGFDAELTETRDFLKLAWAACVSACISAFIGPLALLEYGYLTTENLKHSMLHWWQADTLGMLSGAPLLLVWRRWPSEWFSRQRFLPTLVFWLLTVLVGQVIFLDWFHDSLGRIAKTFWMFLLVVWAAVSYGRRGALLLIAISAFQALYGAVQHIGYFGADLIETELENFWFYQLILTWVGISLAINMEARKRNEKALHDSETRFRLFLNHNPIIAWIKDEDGQLIYANQTYRNRFSLDADANGNNGLERRSRQVAKPFQASDRRVLDTRQQAELTEETLDEKGNPVYWQITKFPFQDSYGSKFIGGLGRDDTERRLHETQVWRFTQTYAALAETNRAVRHAGSETDLFDVVCRIAVKQGGMQMAWIGKLQKASEDMQPIAYYCANPGHMNELADTANSPIPGGYGAACIAIRDGQAVIIQNIAAHPGAHQPQTEAKDGFDWQSSAAFPIYRAGRPYAVLSIYHAEKNAFDELLAGLLNDMVKDIGFALDVLATEVERKAAEQKLILYGKIFETTLEGILITDANHDIIDVNQAFSRITGYSRQDALGNNITMLKFADHNAYYADIWQTVKRNGHWSGELWKVRKNGEVYPEWMSISAIVDTQGEASHFVGISSDISVIKQHEKQLEKIAHFDALTGIPNRVLLADRLQQALSRTRRQQNMLAICYLDLDSFKPINDSHGHEAGDKVLIEIAHRIGSALRGDDTVARLGGDEFVILLLDIESRLECANSLDRLLSIIAKPIPLLGQLFTVTASIGVSLYPLDDESADILMRHADQAMYIAKNMGKNCFHIFDPDQDSRQKQHHAQRARLKQGIQANEFVLFYQPKVDMHNLQVVGVEALIRWKLPEEGLLLPHEFLPHIENHELEIQIGEWVIDTALAQMEQWRNEQLELDVSINIAASQLQSAGFVDMLHRKLAEHPLISPQRLQIEILETAALADISAVAAIIQACAGLGVRFALDDFGTGFSSLAYLRRLPADTLKIDQSFVRDMLVDNEDSAIVQGVIALAQTFKRITVAEGVETEQHFQALRRMNCDIGQGYGIARPMPAEEVADWCRTYRQNNPPPSQQDIWR